MATGGRRWWAPAPLAAPGTPITARRAYLEALGVYLAFFGPSIVAAAGSLAGYTAPNPESWWITGSDGFQELTMAALAVTLVVTLARLRGLRPAQVGLAGRSRAGGPGLTQGIRMAAWAAVALVAGSVVTSALATGSFPYGHLAASNTVLDLTAAVNAGFMEETVVLAFVVTTLEQAGRPRAEIAVVALVCRCAYHIYYGVGVVGILVWASTFLWLFWRFRSVIPMIVVHCCWDSLVFLSQISDGFAVLLFVGIFGLGVTAVALWLAERSSQPPPPPTWATWASTRGPSAWGPPVVGPPGGNPGAAPGSSRGA